MRIASPCHEEWNRMDPREAGRHCASCDKTVVDLAGLDVAGRRTRLAEIAREVRAGGRVCVRGRVDLDGALAGSRRLLTGGMALLLAMTFAGCQGDGPQLSQATMTAPVEQTAETAVVATTDDEVQLPKSIEMPDESTKDQVERPHMMGDVAVPEPRQVMMGMMVCPPRDPTPPTAAN